MTHALIFLVEERASRRFGLQPILNTFQSAWEEAAPRHRGVATPWSVVVSVPPAHQEASRFLELEPSTASTLLADWICLLPPENAVHFVGSEGRLSPAGEDFIRHLWSNLGHIRPAKNIGLWLAFRSGSKRIPKITLAQGSIRTLDSLVLPPNNIVILDDTPPPPPVHQPGEQAEIALSFALSKAAKGELAAAKRGASLDPLMLRGNIELLTGDDLMTVGLFDGSLLLLPSLHALAAAIRQLRTAGTNVEIVLVGDSPSLWLVRDLKHMSHVMVSFQGTQTPPVSTASLDDAARDAAYELLRGILDAYPLGRWPSHATETFNELVSVWPSLESLRGESTAP
jgi:hypothetical protein